MKRIVRCVTGTALIAMALARMPSASAAEGWYLFVPPIGDYNERAEFLDGYKILATSPLSRWTQQGAYDSASECEAAKTALLRVEQNSYSKLAEDYVNALGAQKEPALLKHMRWITERTNANVNLLAASRCIKSDDPRLGR